MKHLKTFLVFFVAFYFLIGCKNKTDSKQITDYKDYEGFLNTSNKSVLDKTKEDFNFWNNKLKETPNQYPYNAKLASNHSKQFTLTGNINHLKEAERNLIIANEKIDYTNCGYLRSLARNYISQHRFKESLNLLLKAEKLGEDISDTRKMLVDVYLELGNYEKVEEYLTKIKDTKDFDYLIRVSKYNDHLGNLDDAIIYLEKSLDVAKYYNNEDLMQWNYTNLADYYGHAGRIKDSYNAFLEALKIDATDSYAKKGIAWIVYSYERNPKEALRILDAVSKQNSSPDYYLLKADIAQFTNNNAKKEEYIAKYFEAINNPEYGVMYNSYNIELYADNKSTISKAIEIAKTEVNQRPTAQSYDLLAWSYFKNGETEKALEIVNNHVLGHTFEPAALLHAAHILKANGKTEKVNEIKPELLGSIYELGPLAEEEINNI